MDSIFLVLIRVLRFYTRTLLLKYLAGKVLSVNKVLAGARNLSSIEGDVGDSFLRVSRLLSVLPCLRGRFCSHPRSSAQICGERVFLSMSALAEI
jgi:hypothetical protein